MIFRNTATALAVTASLLLAACGGGSDDAETGSTEPDPEVSADDSGDDSASDAEFAAASIDSAAVCAALPDADVGPLFDWAEFFFGEPAFDEERTQCNYTATNGDASILVNAGIKIENEGGADGFAAQVEKWEAIADVEAAPGFGDDAVIVTDANGHESMFVLDGDRVLHITASTASSDKSIVDVLPGMAELAVAAL